MRRRRLTPGPTLSLLLCAAVCALWVRSYFVWDVFDWPGPSGPSDRGSIGAVHGHVFLDRAWSRTVTIQFSRPLGYHRQLTGPPAPAYPPPGWSFAGFSFTRVTVVGIQYFDARAPLWPVALALALPPLVQWVRRRPVPGRCPTCGYDLRSSPTRCPECGTPVEQQPRQTPTR